MMRSPTPLTGFDRLTLTGFIGLLVATWWKILFLDGLVAPAIASGTMFLALTAALVAIRTRWIPAVAAAVAAFAVVGAAQSDVVQNTLANPSDVGDFASSVLLLAAGAIGATGGVGATVQRYRTMKAAE
jgi:hypothetical protein